MFKQFLKYQNIFKKLDIIFFIKYFNIKRASYKKVL